MSKNYVAIIEKGPTNYGAYLPDLPCCVAVADTEEEVVKLIREAVVLHLDSLRSNGDTVPSPSSKAITVEA